MLNKKSFAGSFMNGLIHENPIFILMLGMCPTLGVTTAAINGIGMGLATTFVLVCSNLLISLMRHIIPDKVRLPSYIVIIATFVTVVDMVMSAYLPDLRAALGSYIPLIVVNCIIFARAEAFAAKNAPVAALGDGLGMGLGFTWAITLLAAVRELFGNGTIFGANIMPAGYEPMTIMTRVAGGFITLGLLLIVFTAIREAIEHGKKKEAA